MSDRGSSTSNPQPETADPEPRLSVVVRVVGGGLHLGRCLEELARQCQGRPVEIIVPHDGSDTGIDALKIRFPQVRFLRLDQAGTRSAAGPADVHRRYDLCTARGLAAARGTILASVEDYGAPAEDWCEQTLRAHDLLPHAAVGGAVEHAGTGRLNWAVYFLDFGRYRLPLTEGPAHYLTDVNVSYKRAALEGVRETWAESYNEVTVHWALARRGGVLWLRPGLIVREDRGRLAPGPLLVERFWWGRLFGAHRAAELTIPRRCLLAAAMPIMPAVLVGRIARKVFSTRRSPIEFVRALPAMIVLAAAWCLGEAAGYISGRAGSERAIADRVEVRAP